MSKIEIIAQRKYSKVLKKQTTYRYLKLGEQLYDINSLTDSGSWISKMYYNTNKDRLTITIDKDWWSSEGNRSGILRILAEMCAEHHVPFPSEVIIKSV